MTLEVEETPLVKEGERYILFLREVEGVPKYRVLGGYAGRFQVVEGKVQPQYMDMVAQDVKEMDEPKSAIKALGTQHPIGAKTPVQTKL